MVLPLFYLLAAVAFADKETLSKVRSGHPFLGQPKDVTTRLYQAETKGISVRLNRKQVTRNRKVNRTQNSWFGGIVRFFNRQE